MWRTRFIMNVSGWATVAEQTLVADTPWRRLRGLLGRDHLDRGEGMLLAPEWAIHSAFMRFPIDALFLDADMRVLSIVEHMGPWRVESNRKAKAVLELAAGEATARGVKEGDQLLVLASDPAATGELPPHYAIRRSAAAVERPLEEVQQVRRTMKGRTPAKPAPAPTTIMIASHDRRFRAVVSALLERRGLRVTVTDNPDVLLESLDGERPDVVVLDATRAARPAATIVGELAAARPYVGVVVVADEPVQTTGFAVHPKWGVFSELAAAIERAKIDDPRRREMIGA
jgi:uncharacterized membrane protein (UPF0127 family)